MVAAVVTVRAETLVRAKPVNVLPSPFQIIGAHADSDLKHSLTRGLGESGESGNVGFQLVAPRTLFVKTLRWRLR